MVIRDSLKCLTCDQMHTIRVWVGHNIFQRHDFSCHSCLEPIALGMHIDFENIATSFEYLENCEKSYEEGVVINLNPHFMIEESQINKDLNFSWMQHAIPLVVNQDIRPRLLLNETEYKFRDIYEQLGGLTRITDYWLLVKKAWSLTNSNKSTLADRALKKYNPPAFSGARHLDSVARDFVYRLTLPRAYMLSDNALKALSDAKHQYPNQLKVFLTYYMSNMRVENIKRYFECFSEYFENYSEYDQALLYVKNSSSVPEGCIATSYGFNKTKMFYGNAYESYTTNIAVLACLNNILSGRNFDQFESMNLEKYLTINKANRGNPFSNNNYLSPFLVCADSSLRNASHHNAMVLIDKGRRIQYQSGGTGSVNVITYSQYLERCNLILLSMASLYLFECELKKMYSM